MRIGILGHGFVTWGGGIDFLRLIGSSLLAASPNLELHVLLPISERHPYFGQRAKTPVARFLKNFLWPGRRRATQVEGIILDMALGISTARRIHLVEYGDEYLASIAQNLKLDVLLPSMAPLQTPDIPWIGYLYDYQHAYLPALFTAEEIAGRNQHFRWMLQTAKHVVVNSQAVANDVARFNPDHLASVVVLPFAASPDPSWFKAGPTDPKKYGITGQYFIICNQFWQHKDHLTAWKAMAVVQKEFPEVELVCTGETSDSRNERYFAELFASAEKLGIAPRLKILGLIPKLEQVSLLRQAVALIQPTRFEGGPGGGATYDAVSLGVPALISDIPVNKEIDEPDVSYFPVGEETALAALMIAQLYKSKSRISRKPNELLKRGHRRRVLSGQKLLQVIEAAIAKNPQKQ